MSNCTLSDRSALSQDYFDHLIERSLTEYVSLWDSILYLDDQRRINETFVLLSAVIVPCFFEFTPSANSSLEQCHVGLDRVGWHKHNHLIFYESARTNLLGINCHLPHRACSLAQQRSEEHTSELQSRRDLVCRLLLEKKKKQ